MRIAFVGDFMLSGNHTRKKLYISKSFNTLFDSADLRVAILETAVGEYEDIDQMKMPKSEVSVWSNRDDIHLYLSKSTDSSNMSKSTTIIN